MQIHRDPLSDSPLPRGLVVSIGNYDGLHLGHRRILEETIDRARLRGSPSGAITFHPHPVRILAPGKGPRLLLSQLQKEQEISNLGIDHLFVVPFTRDFSMRPAEDFVRRFLIERIGVHEVVIGAGFHFGHERTGNLEQLKALGTELGFEAHGVPHVEEGGQPISSTRIRKALAAGEVALAARLLGRRFAVGGLVARGAQLGRKLGYPTVNVRPEGETIPASGVYVTRLVRVATGAVHSSVTNIGVRPTVDERNEQTIEAHIFDFAEEIYGEEIQLEFLERLRPEHRFASLGELTEQIAVDVESAAAWFSTHSDDEGAAS